MNHGFVPVAGIVADIPPCNIWVVITNASDSVCHSYKSYEVARMISYSLSKKMGLLFGLVFLLSLSGCGYYTHSSGGYKKYSHSYGHYPYRHYGYNRHYSHRYRYGRHHSYH